MVDFLHIAHEKGLITDEQFNVAAAKPMEEGVSVLDEIVSMGVEQEELKLCVADYYNVEPGIVDKESSEIDSKVLAYIPEESARHYRMVPLSITDEVLNVGVMDPENLALKDVLNFISVKNNIPYKFVFLFENELEEALTAYENLTGEVDEALTSIEAELNKSQSEDGDDITDVDREHIKEDAPVTKIVATILRYAVDGGASDIHIEPTEERVQVRFRVDGVLEKSLELPRDVQYAVAARVKILASLRLDEKRKPQDGRFSAKIDGRKIDFRVSVLPTNHGEKVVMRILDSSIGVRVLSDIGVSKYGEDIIMRAVNLPYGMVLISGPTGSGKSTTLYAMLEKVDRLGKNVLSLEDPIEYNIEGVSQSQVRPEIGYTFARGLRSSLRQDPDIIMVGEIRDKETAQLAIQAALTGHLVFSTIHTNTSIGVIARLVDMGIDPYLIAPTLKLAIAQRLARRICEGTGKEEKVSSSMKTSFTSAFESLPEKYSKQVPSFDSILRPEQTPGCATGTKGRVAIVEMLEVDSSIERLILNRGAESEIYEEARKNGFISMREDAIIKALEHKIPYEEVNKFNTSMLNEETLETFPETETPDVVGDTNEIAETDDVITDVDNPEIETQEDV